MLLKTISWKWLGEVIHHLLKCVHRKHGDLLGSNVLPKVVILVIDVPCSRAHFWYICQLQHPQIVFKYCAVHSGFGQNAVIITLSNFIHNAHQGNDIS